MFVLVVTISNPNHIARHAIVLLQNVSRWYRFAIHSPCLSFVPKITCLGKALARCEFHAALIGQIVDRTDYKVVLQTGSSATINDVYGR